MKVDWMKDESEPKRNAFSLALFAQYLWFVLVVSFRLPFSLFVSFFSFSLHQKADREDDGSLKLERILGFRHRWAKNDANTTTSSSTSNGQRSRPSNNGSTSSGLDQVKRGHQRR